MFLARKLLLTAATALTTLALTASAAWAQPEVMTEPDAEHCPAVVAGSHGATGGCHLESTSSAQVTLHAYAPQKITISSCDISLEGVTDENAQGYITEATLSPPSSGSVPCTRQPCDEVVAPGNHPMIPWPAHLRENGPGDEEIITEFCIRATFSGEGGTGTWCELHSTFVDLGEHQYQLGTGQEEFCENNPGTGYIGPHSVLQVPISIETTIQTSGGDEGFEVIH